MLVCIYGFSGCFANRFNNVAVFNEINAIARRVLVQSANLCLARGFEVLYVNTDSLFIKRNGATREDFEEVAEAIKKQTGLPIAVDHHYKFIVFMNQRTHTEIEAMNRFYGKLTNGELYYRGIELRRRDCPAFLKNFQEKLITTIFDAGNGEEVLGRGVEEAEAFTQDIHRRILNGDVDPRELAVSKHVRKEVDAYRAMLPHVIAAKHLIRNGKRLEEYSSVDYIYTNAVHSNPMRRVLPSLLMEDNHGYYDRERYARLLLDVAYTVLKPLEAHTRPPAILESFLS